MKGKRNSKGFTLIELLVTVAIILVIVAIAIPSYLSAKNAANKSSGAATLRSINTSESLYQSNCFGSFSSTIVELGNGGGTLTPCTPFVGGATPTKMTTGTLATLGDTALTSGSPATKGGYVFTYTPGAADATTGVISSWVETAIPVTPGSGTQALCIDSSSNSIHASAVGTNTAGVATGACTDPTL
jgi:prepilin-type N-terminal cleavage/methylation domain-containing protein